MTVRIRGANSYSYRSIRTGNQVRTMYLGTGDMAQILSNRREAERERFQVERQVDQERTRALIEWSRQIDGLVRTALEAAGYHRHERGNWRKRRMATSDVQPAKPAPTPPAMTPEAKAIERRWIKKDKKITREEAQILVAARPDLVESHGSPAGTFFLALMARHLGPEKVQFEATRRKYFRVRRDLAGPTPTPTESLLAERAALCWLEVTFLQGSLEMGEDSPSVAVATYRQKRIDAAHRRFLSAVKTLAVVRKLALPAVLVNVDGRSVHFDAPATPASVAVPTIHNPGE